MPARLHRPDRRLDPDHAVDRRRAHDRAVGLGADGQRDQVGRRRRARAGARAARVAIERVGVAALPAARAPAAGRVRSRASWPTRSGWPCRAGSRRPRAAAAPRTTSCGGTEPSSASEPAVVVIRSAVSMLSFSAIGMPCSGPRTLPALRSASSWSAIASASGLSLDERAQLRARAVQGLDAGQVALGDRAGGEPSRSHRLLEVVDGRLVKFERLVAGGGAGGRGGGAGRRVRRCGRPAAGVGRGEPGCFRGPPYRGTGVAACADDARSSMVEATGTCAAGSDRATTRRGSSPKGQLHPLYRSLDCQGGVAVAQRRRLSLLAVKDELDAAQLTRSVATAQLRSQLRRSIPRYWVGAGSVATAFRALLTNYCGLVTLPHRYFVAFSRKARGTLLAERQ